MVILVGRERRLSAGGVEEWHSQSPFLTVTPGPQLMFQQVFRVPSAA